MSGGEGAPASEDSSVAFGRCAAAVIEGIEARRIDVEVDIRKGLPFLRLVGLPSASVKESEERVKSAIRHAGFEWPRRRVTVNLAPADIRKEGSAFDLPIALGILAASGRIPAERLANWMALGELSLDGALRPVRGALSFALLAARNGFGALVLPRENQPEAALCGEIGVAGAGSLAEAVLAVERGAPERSVASLKETAREIEHDFADVRGQEHVKRAALVAAAGAHNFLMIGPPGSGKTMVARRIPGILPDLSLDEAMECLRIHSVAGTGGAGLSLVPPFRSPHHTASRVGMIGGGSPVRPGEVTLAQNGVLFLDELPEFARDVLESLRQPLEDGVVTVTRARSTVTFPTRFMLVAAMNPCPCGLAGTEKRCRCSETEVIKYRRRISGPLLDRIDIQVEAPRVRSSAARSASEWTSAAMRDRVREARERQRARYGALNAAVPPRRLQEGLGFAAGARVLLEDASESLGLSARSVDKIRRIARTVADIAGSVQVDEEHLAEAVRFRSLDYVGQGAGA